MIAAVVAACTPPPPQPTVEEVSIVGGNRTMEVGDTVPLDVTVVVTGGASQDVTWSSSDETIVSVDSDGTITGEAVGSAEITATSVADPGISDTITVTVTEDDPEPSVTSVTIDGGDRTVALWETASLSVTVVVTGGASQDVTWSSSNATAVNVTFDGSITALSADSSAEITATSIVDPDISDTITITVEALPEPDLANIVVDAAVPPGGNGSALFPFDTVTDGIEAVDPGGTVQVLAGLYTESLFIDKSMALLGAGADVVTIRSDGNAPGSDSSVAIASVNGLTLSGFRLEVEAPGPITAALGMTTAVGSTNVLIEDVEIRHTNSTANTRGVNIFNSSNVTVRNVSIEATSFPEHSGAGVWIAGASSGIELDSVTTSNHEAFAGVVLRPLAGGIADVTITNESSFDEINKMTLILDLGSVSGLDAPQFVAAVGTTSSAYGGGTRFFYKTDLDQAILDSLFNFNVMGDDGERAWVHVTVQPLDAVDQSIRQNSFVIGTAEGSPYGFVGTVRSHFLQAAIDVADPGATLTIQEGTFAGADEPFATGVVRDGATVIDVTGVSVVGQGSASVISASEGPVFTINADNVSISNVEITSPEDVTGILMGTGDLLTVLQSNLLTDVAIDNTSSASVTATNNYWGAADGPSGDGPGSGSELIDPTDGVVFVPFAAAPF